MSVQSLQYIRTLHRLLDQHFNLAELELLAFDLGIDYEHLPGNEKLTKINSFILYLMRRGQLAELVESCQTARPFVSWPDPPVPEEQINYSEFLTSKENISIKGDVIGSAIGAGASAQANIIAGGDVTVNYHGNYERLQDAYIDPWPVFERVDLKFFTGREWLISEIDNFLQRHGRGYLVLDAEAGLGKTTVLANLVRERSYIHHFVELSPGINGIGPGLKSLAAQLITTYQLESHLVAGLLPGAAEEPRFFHALLNSAAKKRTGTEKIVVVIDALDEAGILERQNPLGLPRTLPEGVYVIVSQRPNIKLRIEANTPVELFKLHADSSENQADLSRYLWQATRHPSIASILDKQKYKAGEFVQTLRAKSQGVWIYAYYVLQEIVNGTRKPLDLEALPNGLTSYYVDYWRRQRDEDEVLWDEVHLPLLAMLAASQEPITVERLLEWSQINQQPQWVRRRLQEQWRPFITIVMDNSQSRYRFFHATLQDLFDSRINWEKLNEFDRSIVEDLIEATQEAHSKLITRYQDAWGSLNTLSNFLQDFEAQNLDEGYGLRHIIPHLKAVYRNDDVHQLLAVEDGRQQNVWFTAKEQADKLGDYLNDIFSAWELVELDSSSSPVSRKITLQMRYALIHSSIVSRSDNTLPFLFGELVRLNIWSQSKALRYAERIVNPNQKSRTLGWLAPHLSDSNLEIALGISRAMLYVNALGVFTCDAYADAVGYLLPFLPKKAQGDCYDLLYYSVHYNSYLKNSARIVGKLSEQFREAEIWELFNEVVYEIVGDYNEDYADWWKSCLDYLARHMSLETLNRARATIRLRCSQEARRDALTVLLPHLARLGRPDNAAKLIQKYFDGNERLSLMSEIAHFLPKQHFETLYLDVLNVPDDYERREILRRNFLPHIVRTGELDRAFGLITELNKGLRDASNYKWLIGSLARPISDQTISRLLSEAPATAIVVLVDQLLADNDTKRALRVWRQVENNVTANDILWLTDSPHFIWLCNYANDKLIREATLLATCNAGEVFWNGGLQFPQTKLQLKVEWVQAALTKLHIIADTESQLGLLAALSSRLSPQLVQGAFQLVKEIELTGWTVRYVNDLMPNLPESLQEQAEELISPYLSLYKRSVHDLHEDKAIQNKDSMSILPSDIDDIAKWISKYSAKVQADLLQTLPSHIPEEHLAALEDLIWGMEDELEQAEAVGSLARRYAKSAGYQRAVGLIYRVHEDLWEDPGYSPTVIVLKKVAPYLPNEHLVSATYIACFVRYDDPRCRALRILLPHLLKCSDEIQYAIFQGPLGKLATYSRTDLLTALRELAPIILHLGGHEAAENVARTVRDVCRWWP